MASGRSHDRATVVLALPLGLLIGLWQTPWLGLVAMAGFLVGGLWLSPDLDTRSRPTRRWGALALLWWPYRRLVRHRGWLSHTPLLGTATRLMVLSLWLLLLLTLLQLTGAITLSQSWDQLQLFWLQHKPTLITLLLALEASAWLHLIQDGDPMPPPARR